MGMSSLVLIMLKKYKIVITLGVVIILLTSIYLHLVRRKNTVQHALLYHHHDHSKVGSIINSHINLQDIHQDGHKAYKNLARDFIKKDPKLAKSRTRQKQHVISQYQKNVIEKYAKNLLFCKDVPGMTIGIVKNESEWHLPVGVRDLNNGSPVTAETKFLIGSMTKTFTAQLAALMIQESEGQLTWDTPLVQIMGPNFHLASAELMNEITLRDILSHRSGLVSGNLAVRASLPKNLRRIDLLKLFHHIPVNSELRKEFLYSYMGYTLAGAVIEHYWKRPWRDLLKEKLFQPLEMNQSSAVQKGNDLLGDEFAKPYIPVEGLIEDCEPRLYELGPMEVTGSVASSAKDMTKWIRFILGNGRKSSDGSFLLNSNLLADMWVPNIQLGPTFKARTEKRKADGWSQEDTNLGYGMGWFLNKYRGLKNIWHSGGLYSYFSLVWVFPEARLGFFISINGYKGCSHANKSQAVQMGNTFKDTNNVSAKDFMGSNTHKCLCGSSGLGIIESLAYIITDTMLGFKPWLSESNGCSYPYPWIKCKNKKANNSYKGLSAPNTSSDGQTQVDVNAYKGVYKNELLGKVNIYAILSSPHLQFHLRVLKGILVFRGLHDPQTAVFGLETTGSYRFLSKPDNLSHITAKQAFVLKFHSLPKKTKAGVLNIYFSEDEKPFVFHRLRVKKNLRQITG